jgi:ERF superfamily
MHRSSESFAALATALAKAQAHLVNPEKSLTATIRTGRPGETARSFRYAPLSSGLEIVRKTLSEHEIAVIQTTAVDQPSRLLTLTTLLAHSSGEWIASYWPVCSVAEVANPHRMGAALTYARRYALFTLVGIAGEDDLDAPDLCMPAPATGSSTAGLQFPPQTQGNGKLRGAVKTPSLMVLPVDESAALRDRLLSEVAGLASQDSATSWVREALASKNSLTATDAKTLEDAFEQKLSGYLSAEAVTPVAGGDAPSISATGSPEAGPSKGTEPDQPPGIDRSVLTISVPRRYRNKEHLRFVIRQPCLLCGRKPSDPHHLRFVQPRALGRKSSDEFAVPLCRIHHRAVHRAGDERAWWKTTGIDPLKVACKLWKDTLVSKPHGAVGAAVHEPQKTSKSSPVDSKTP